MSDIKARMKILFQIRQPTGVNFRSLKDRLTMEIKGLPIRISEI